jgi:hypothetical protein
MPIERLESPEWSHGTISRNAVAWPSWAQVEAAIRTLDQAMRQEVYLHPLGSDLETWLCVAGGNGAYIVTGSLANETFPTYVDASQTADPSVSLLVGGQKGEYPANWVVGLEHAVALAKAFFDAGGFECGVNWIEC